MKLEIDQGDHGYKSRDFSISVASRDRSVPDRHPVKTVEKETDMNKIIITVVGKDTVGIIAKVCTYLADNGINILDISQTIVQGYF